MRSSPPSAPAAARDNVTGVSFADDLAFLKHHGAVLELQSPRGARVIVSPKYQGRVMTSAVDPGGRSLGFVHRAFIEAGHTGTAFDNYGGEDRFWLGPEGGQFGLYFAKGSPFDFDHWQTPHPMQEGEWAPTQSTATSVTMTKTMSVSNWSGTAFDVAVERTVALLGSDDAQRVLGMSALEPPGVRAVAFETRNKITNVGKNAWKKDTGLVSIWILAMYAPAADAHVVIPFRPRAAGDTAPVVNDTYFGKVPADRLAVREDEGHLIFAADGKYRSKIGIRPTRAKNVLGSYSPSAKLLTIVVYDPPAGSEGGGVPYVNSMWEKQSAPYAGDVINSYNDGPPAPGKPPLGGFYELETSSPGVELAPKASAMHVHRTFHFVGEESALEPIAKQVLGVSLTRMTN